MASQITPGSARPLSITPGSRVLQSPLSDETIWKRLKEAGFDEESIKRRDKSALIAYIAKLEAEIFDHQHHMGLLIMERKELTSKCEQIKSSAEAVEMMHKRDQAAHLSALAGARKREENLKKAIGVEKECIASLEKALHEMRAEFAETKVAAESKFSEARIMVEDAQKKFLEAEAKIREAESLQAEASRYNRAAERKLQEVEAREDDISRRIISFKCDCDAKEKEITLERQSLSERQKSLQQEHERLLDGQALLNQREDHIFNRSQELIRLEKEMDVSRANIEKELRSLNDEKSNLELALASLSRREEAVIEREALLTKKEQDLLVAQEKLANKESVESQKIIANHETILRTRKAELEAELDTKRKLVEDDIEIKRRAWELREMDLTQREHLLLEREHDLEAQSNALAYKEKDVTERSNYLDEKEQRLSASEKEIMLKNALLQKEKEEISKIKLELQNSLSSLEDKKKQVDGAKEKLEAMKSETNELSVLEMKLKEELDMVRAQKLELMAEADKLKIEKAKFEAEWELIDEKREELQKEAERISSERQAVSKFLKDERDSIRLERDAMRDQLKHDIESLNHEREEFMNKMVHEHSELFCNSQQERAEFLLGIEMHKRELEDCFNKRREELENDLREREKTFEQEKKSQLQYISSVKETAEKELEQVAQEMKRLDAERMEINLDREQRNREWAELTNSIEALKDQREKLKQQRELLHVDREGIHAEIEILKKLEDLKSAADIMAVSEMTSRQKISTRRSLQQQTNVGDANLDSLKKIGAKNNCNGFNSPPMPKPNSASPQIPAFSWIRRCSELIFKHSPEKPLMKDGGSSLTSHHDETSLTLHANLNSSNGYGGKEYKGYKKSQEILGWRRNGNNAVVVEPKVILEVPPDVRGSGDADSEIKEDGNADSEIKEDACGQSADSVSEQWLQAGRKRKNEMHTSHHLSDPSLVQTQNNKKRREQEDTPRNESEEAVTHSQTFTQPNVPEDHYALISANPANGGVEETSELIIHEIIKISDVTHGKFGDDNFADQEKTDRLQNLVVESGHSILEGGGTNGHADSTNIGSHVIPVLSLTEGVMQEPGENVGQLTDHNQYPEQWTTMSSDQKHGDYGVAVSVDSKKADEIIGRRTRSKLKL
ncbi:hypothetical protein CFOL_v3_01204 [Cephalotus follicularis]|uniref:Uncharacterized protein n=1 Tax=Cephalotus follicularis TaxID=3775 RepID=A0A1Q3API6_CEPFO|nr:hypothetical protein CFOL_v3_01204 [Cephalotus follicularis]